MNNDLISISALFEIVEPRLTFLRKEYGFYDQYTDGYEECADRIEAAPAVDAVEVVRCCQCEYSWFRLAEPYSRYCKHTGLNVGDNDFCSYGERKTE